MVEKRKNIPKAGDARADWREATRLHIYTSRLAVLQAYLEKSKAEQRELLRKRQEQLTNKHKKLLAGLKEHITLANRLIEKVQLRLDSVREGLKFNRDATVTVRALLTGDVQFMAQDITIVGDSSVSEFVVRTRAVNNTHFSKIPDSPSKASND